MLLQGAEEPVERRPVAPLGDPPKDAEVPVDVEVRTTAPEVEEAEPAETPGLVQMEVEDDLQGRSLRASLASA